MITRGREAGEMEVYSSKGIKLQFCYISKSRDLMCSIMTVINNAVLNTGYLLRVDFRCSSHMYTHIPVPLRRL